MSDVVFHCGKPLQVIDPKSHLYRCSVCKTGFVIDELKPKKKADRSGIIAMFILAGWLVAIFLCVIVYNELTHVFGG